ncbi:hypothetical protein BHM03_00027974 [Ensete ventricosum]|nr:hypothetical protein BHM03_00027974 [Ensete ventricosum]
MQVRYNRRVVACQLARKGFQKEKEKRRQINAKDYKMKRIDGASRLEGTPCERIRVPLGRSGRSRIAFRSFLYAVNHTAEAKQARQQNVIDWSGE